jgi:serine protease inhibitor
MSSELSRISRNRDNVHRDMNDRLHSRDMTDINIINDTRKNVKFMNRLEMERDEFLKNSNYNKDDEYESNKSQQINNFIFDDRRMPMRPEFDISRDMYNNNDNFTPQNIDDIKRNKSTNKSILSFEKDSNFADINHDTKLSDNLQDNKICINGINNYGLFLFDNLLETMKCPFIFSPMLIYSMFGSLFIGSDGNTEIELKNYFNFPRSDILISGLNDIYKILTSHTSVICGNCIIFSDNIDYNPQYCKKINNYTKVRRVNINNSEKESNDINKIISHTNKIEKKSISSNIIQNSSIILLNYASINPVWLSHFTKITKQNGIEFMHAFRQTFGYFEQQGLQVIEIISQDNLCMGLIYGDIELNDKSLKFIIANLKPQILEEVKIPKFKLQTKLKYTNILKETDLKTIFLDLKIPELFNNDCEITECIQNIEFNFNEKSIPTKSNIGYVTTRKFIIEKSFRFYLRTRTNNCILFLGTY